MCNLILKKALAKSNSDVNMSSAPFLSVMKQDFNNPYAKPLGSPPPPMDTGIQLYLPRPDPEDCKCDAHGLENKKAR